MSKADLHRLIDELPEGAEQPALWLLRQLQGAGGFTTPQALAQAIVDEPDNRLLLALAAASGDPILEALARDPRDPLKQTNALAPFDDEPLSEDDIQALEEAHRNIREGRVVSHEEMWRSLGH